MDLHATRCKPDMQDTENFCKLHSWTKEKEGELVHDLEDSFMKSLRIEDNQELENRTEDDFIIVVKKRNGFEALELPNTKFTEGHLNKCATFLSSAVKLPSVELSDAVEHEKLLTESSENSMQQSFSQSMSLLTPLKLVSAMKGSRALRGASPKKLRVKWAPDVYDPPQTSLSHTVQSKKHHKSRNKKGKKGQKSSSSSNSSRSAGGKDRKKVRKVGGSSEWWYKSENATESFINTNNDIENFDVGSPDPYCGSIFLKQSVIKVHYSIAEAL